MLTLILMHRRRFFPQYEPGDSRKIKDMENYLRDMFMPLIKEHFPQHYLMKSKSVLFRDYLDSHCLTHRYFLRFNIENFYKKVSKYSIGPVLLRNFEELYGNSAPDQLCQHLEAGPDLWFSERPWSAALPHERNLLCLAAGMYMLGLCMSLNRWPFLCYHHEFVVLFRSEDEIEECLAQVNLELKRLKLDIDEDTISSGEVFHKGFKFMDIEFTGAAPMLPKLEK